MAPKKEKLKEAEASLAATLAILNAKRAELKEVSPCILPLIGKEISSMLCVHICAILLIDTVTYTFLELPLFHSNVILLHDQRTELARVLF